MQRIFHFPQLNSVWSNPVVVVWHDGLIADGKNCVVRYPKGKSIEQLIIMTGITYIACNAPSVDRNVEGWCVLIYL